ncbi:hypothetical protein SCALM49S_06132 [Streptomyces californicus]
MALLPEARMVLDASGTWKLFVLTGYEPREWPVHGFNRAEPVPTVPERVAALAALGYAARDGAEWKWDATTPAATVRQDPRPPCGPSPRWGTRGGGVVNAVQIRSAEKALSVGTWLIVGGAMLFSILTVTPLMERHSPKGWDGQPILPLVVDAAVVIVVRLDSVLAALGGHGGRWPIALRWMTGAMTLALNVADSALKKDLVGAAVHAVAPLLLIVAAETGLAYRRAITRRPGGP